MLREVELELLNRVVPEYRDARRRADRSRCRPRRSITRFCRCCATPTSTCGRIPSRGCRGSRFQHPEDAAEQLERAAACHERLFGRRPVGLWPSEGSVSDAMVPLVGRGGLPWMATDELILARTLGIDVHARRPRPASSSPTACTRRTRVDAGGAAVACVFRDHVLSDLIGFTYAGWPARRGRRRLRRPPGGGRAPLRRTDRRGRGARSPIILDGENAWEHFEGGGRPFLRALYRRLSAPSGAADGDDGRGVPRRPRHAARASFPGRGSTRTSTSGSATRTISGPGASWPTPATALDAPATAAGPSGAGARRARRC